VDEAILEQARSLYETIRLIRTRFFRRHTVSVAAEDGRKMADLTLPQMNALLVIRGRGRGTIKELAEALEVSAPSASAMVDRLVEEGVVSREQSRADRREVVVQLTPQGREAVEHMEQELLRAIVDLLEKIGPGYAAKWCEVYERIHEVLIADSNANASKPENAKVER